MIYLLLRSLAIKLAVTSGAALLAIGGCQIIGSLFSPVTTVVYAAAWSLIVFLAWAAGMKSLT